MNEADTPIVIIDVRGGVAEPVGASARVRVIIRDFDAGRDGNPGSSIDIHDLPQDGGDSYAAERDALADPETRIFGTDGEEETPEPPLARETRWCTKAEPHAPHDYESYTHKYPMRCPGVSRD